MSHRHTLEADVLRHQQAGDFAAQAETLMLLAELAAETALEDDSFSFVQGLYGQAWAAYQRVSDPIGEAKALLGIAESMSRELWNHEDDLPLEFGFMHIHHMRSIAQRLCRKSDDLRGQAEIYRLLGYAAPTKAEAQTLFQQALAFYQTLDNLPMQADVSKALSWTYNSVEPEHWQFLEQALRLYQQIGDRQKEAYTRLQLGEMALREKNFARARPLLETSLIHFIILGSVEAFSAAESLGSLLLEDAGYAAYQCYQMGVARSLRHVPDEESPNMLYFWAGLAKIARKHQDFETASYAYQNAGLYTVGFHLLDEQRADMYWRWGHMEYHALKHRANGVARCQSAVDIMDDSEHRVRYQRKLDHMRSEMAAYKRKNPSS